MVMYVTLTPPPLPKLTWVWFRAIGAFQLPVLLRYMQVRPGAWSKPIIWGYTADSTNLRHKTVGGENNKLTVTQFSLHSGLIPFENDFFKFASLFTQLHSSRVATLLKNNRNLIKKTDYY